MGLIRMNNSETDYYGLGILTEDLMKRHVKGEIDSDEFVKYIHEVIEQVKQMNTLGVTKFVLSDNGKKIHEAFTEYIEGKIK